LSQIPSGKELTGKVVTDGEMKVSVFVGGVQKSGTRSIANYLRLNPYVGVHKKKEAHFFDMPQYFIGDQPRATELRKYHDGFMHARQTQVFCDITPDYVFRQGAVNRVYSYNSRAKWIILLRNPVERAFSAWNMEVNRGTESLTFEDALISEIRGGSKERAHDRFKYIARSRYYDQLLKLWECFPKNQCYVCAAEEMWSNPKAKLSELAEFLKIPQFDQATLPHVHKGKYISNISRRAQQILFRELGFEFNTLPSLLGWESNPWKLD